MISQFHLHELTLPSIQEVTTLLSFRGHAAYGSAVKLVNDEVQSSYFMTYHSVLTNSSDYITAYKRAVEVSNEINDVFKKKLGPDSNVEVFPYR